jgi:hypothetical protein
MKHLLFSLMFFLLVLNLKAMDSDSSFVKSFYGGSSITIPEGKSWKINKAFISANDGYNIQINLNNFKNEYKGGEKLSIPYYIAEMELLSKKEMMVYFLYIKEENISR